MPVALQFKNVTHQKTIVIDSKYSGEIFYSNIGFVADTILIDPEYWIISRNNTVEKITDNMNGENVIQVFPNPVQNHFYIYLRNFSLPDASVSLYTAIGQLVFKKVLILLNGADFEEISSAHLVPGVYFLKIRSGSSVKFIKKILKQ